VSPPTTEALTAATASLSVAAQERAAKDAAKKAAKAEAAEQKHADKLASSMVTIKRIERNKRKYVTSVTGLEAFGLELKKVRFYFSFLSFSVLYSALLCAWVWSVRPGGGSVLTERTKGVQGLWQEICDRVVRHQDAERWGGDCGAG
jgi:hypothetical protein